MKHSEMAAALRRAAADMQLIAIMDGDWEMPDEMVLTYISNFLTDASLRRPRTVKPSAQSARGTVSDARVDNTRD
jgi:hypothetical protein